MAYANQGLDTFPILRSKRLESASRSCPLLDGDPEAWVACCSRRFFPLARRIARDDDLALDILQESWVKILEVTHAYRGGPPACAWVRTIVANSAIDARRKRKAETREEELGQFERLEDPGQSPEAWAAEKELLEMLSAMLSVLPETYRQILELRYAQGLTTKETAEQLQISRANVSVRLNRAISMLRRRFERRMLEQAAEFRKSS